MLWVPVIGYEGLYEVSDAGQVRSLERVEVLPSGAKRSRRGRTLRQHVDRDGYAVLNLCRDGKPSRKTVSRLMGEAFLDAGPETRVVMRDRDLTNLSLDNLQVLPRKPGGRG